MMQFFKHDSNMLNDVKIQLLMIEHGAIAYAVYCAALETITASINENSCDCSFLYASLILAKNLMMKKDEVETILAKCIELELFSGDASGTIYCPKILTRLNQNEINPNLRKAVKAAKENCQNKEKLACEKESSVSNDCDTNHENCDSYHDTPVTNISTEKEIEKEIEPESELDLESDIELDQEKEILIKNKINITDSVSDTHVPVPDPQKNFAQDVFNTLVANDIPRPKSFIDFVQRDFRLALQDISSLRLRSDELITALNNYGKVLALDRQGESWWGCKQNLYNFLHSKTILKFLPDTFNLEDFKKKKRDGIYTSLVDMSGCDKVVGEVGF